jgi:anti-sigma factor RsiW
MMDQFKVLYCKARMAAYLDGELPAHAHRRVARYIDECPACYAEYARQRDLRRDLLASMPALGQPAQPSLDRIWSAVQQDLAAPTPPPRRLRYGVVIAAIALMLFVPMIAGSADEARSMALPPTPDGEIVAAATETPLTPPLEATPVVVGPTVQATDDPLDDINPEAAITPEIGN